MGAPIDLQGRRFGRLVVVSIASAAPRRWVCRCDCGQETAVRSLKLLHGGTRSCGCLQREVMRDHMTTHGMRHTPTYRSWSHMKNRCLNPKHSKFHLWGGRGIGVCERWRESFDNFLADMGEAPVGTSIDRIDNDRGYEPGNCRWASPRTQSNNLRTTRRFNVGNECLTITEWADKLGVSRDAIKLRLRRGQDIAHIVSAFSARAR